MFRVRGDNEFHDGWLAWVLGQPYREGADEDWRLGWKTASESVAGEPRGPNDQVLVSWGRMLWAMQEMVKRGQVVVHQVPLPLEAADEGDG